MKNFKQLMIWQKGMEIWKEVYLLSKELPTEEKYGIVSQINRASFSIPANIAEGSSRDSKKDFARFLQIALGSSFELETFLIGIKMLELTTSENDVDRILELVDEEQKMIMSFKNKVDSTRNS
ncbi:MULTISPECIES: four helix bundle protein [unclassified Ekhidna]|jgi:four helix bundle protein|uniref:four helix bundle protein n=1 Tax=unclassified Ekhidna TaxID=2632188 RepID=UPI0032E030F7